VEKRLIGSGCSGGEWGRSRGILDGWRSLKGKGSFGGKCRVSHCNKWGLCGIVMGSLGLDLGLKANIFGLGLEICPWP